MQKSEDDRADCVDCSHNSPQDLDPSSIKDYFGREVTTTFIAIYSW